jgi:hypothetical protein
MTYASGVTYWEQFLPGLTIVFLAIAVLPWLSRDNSWIRTGVIALCLKSQREREGKRVRAHRHATNSFGDCDSGHGKNLVDDCSGQQSQTTGMQSDAPAIEIVMRLTAGRERELLQLKLMHI